MSPRTSPLDSSQVRPSENGTTRAQSTSSPFPVTPSKPVISISTRSTSSQKATHRNITFPSYVRSPTHSLESISSYGPLRRPPLPVMMTSQDGATYLDWSGAPPTQGTTEKDKSLLGRTFSLTKRRSKGENVTLNRTGRHSVDFAASQGDLHAGKSKALIAVVGISRSG